MTRPPGVGPGSGPASSSASGQGERIRVLIVDDHQMVRAGLRAMLRDTKVEIVGEAANLEGALAEIDEHAPDAVLLDVRLQGQSGLEACRVITQKHPNLAVVFLTVRPCRFLPSFR